MHHDGSTGGEALEDPLHEHRRGLGVRGRRAVRDGEPEHLQPGAAGVLQQPGEANPRHLLLFQEDDEGGRPARTQRSEVVVQQAPAVERRVEPPSPRGGTEAEAARQRERVLRNERHREGLRLHAVRLLGMGLGR